jgi:hypothetical protein
VAYRAKDLLAVEIITVVVKVLAVAAVQVLLVAV